MKILMLSWEYPPRIIGGISRVVYHLATELGKLGNEVTVITVKEGDEKDEEVDGNVRVYRVTPFIVDPLNFIDSILQMNLAMISKAGNLFKKGERFDILHLHDWLVAYAGRVIQSIWPEMALVCTFHGTESGRNFGIHNDMQGYISNVEKMLSRMSQRIIVNSGYMKSEIMRLFQIPDEHVFVIPNGVDVRKFLGVPCDYDLRTQYALPHEKLVIFVGRLVGEKGAHILLEAIPTVLSRYGQVKFIIAGKGPEYEALQHRAHELNVAERVIMPGFIPDDFLLRLYKCSDIAVIPSLYEPFGIVALEGMVAGIPVVVSNVGGLNQIVEHRVNGMKFEAGSSYELAECILELLTCPELVKSIIQHASESVNRFYRWDDIAARTYVVYKQALG